MIATFQLAYALLQSSPSQEAIVASLCKHNTMTLSSLKMLDVTKSKVVSVQGLSKITKVLVSSDLEFVVVFTNENYVRQGVYLLSTTSREQVELGTPRKLWPEDARLIGNKVHVLYTRVDGDLAAHEYDLKGNLVRSSDPIDQNTLEGAGVFLDTLNNRRKAWPSAEEHMFYAARERGGPWYSEEVFGLSLMGTSWGNYSAITGRWIVIDQLEGNPFRYRIGSVSNRTIRTIDFQTPMAAFEIRMNEIVSLSRSGKIIVISPQGRVLASSNEKFADFLCGHLDSK